MVVACSRVHALAVKREPMASTMRALDTGPLRLEEVGGRDILYQQVRSWAGHGLPRVSNGTPTLREEE